MRPIKSFLACSFLLLSVLAAPVRADVPALRLSWDRCDPVIVNHSWDGPGLYVLQVSAIGLSGSYQRAEMQIRLAPRFPVRAWNFVIPTLGPPACHGAAGLTVIGGGVDCPAAPALSVAGNMQYPDIITMEPLPPVLQGSITFEPWFVANPAQRYGLFRFVFDQTNSTTGFPDPLHACGGAEQPLCLAVATSELIDEQSIRHSWTTEQAFVTWQDSPNSLGCPGATPARALTWGQIKNQYR